MNNAPMTPEEFRIFSTAVLTGLLILVALAGADWLKDYKRAVIPKDSRLKTPQKAFQAFSGIWLAAANFILLILTSGPRYTLPEILQVLATTAPILLGITLILPALIVGTYHLLRITRIAVGFLARILIIILPAWFIGKILMKLVTAWSQFMTKTLIKTSTPTNSERAR
jgi:hypothetical protein